MYIYMYIYIHTYIYVYVYVCRYCTRDLMKICFHVVNKHENIF